MRTPDPFTLIIFGATCDLARRKLFPALLDLFQGQHLPEDFTILALGRKDDDDEHYRESLRQGLTESESIDSAAGRLTHFLQHVQYLQVEIGNPDDYPMLGKHLERMSGIPVPEANLLSYLTTPPDLAIQGLNRGSSSKDRKRLVIEKPIGHDLLSTRELNRVILNHFDEEQVYRIDHYLGKKSVQNLLAFRFSNGIFEPLWNRHFIHHVELTSVEYFGVGSRGSYYDHLGALHDMVQNHFLQLLSIVAMEPCHSSNPISSVTRN